MSTRRHQWPPPSGISVDASRLSMGEYLFFCCRFGYTLFLHVGRYHLPVHRHSSILPSYLHRSHFHFHSRPPLVLILVLVFSFLNSYPPSFYTTITNILFHSDLSPTHEPHLPLGEIKHVQEPVRRRRIGAVDVERDANSTLGRVLVMVTRRTQTNEDATMKTNKQKDITTDLDERQRKSSRVYAPQSHTASIIMSSPHTGQAAQDQRQQ